MTNNNEILKKEQYWDKEWINIFDHYQQDIRHAYYIRALKKRKEKKILEIAAGSFRDMAALNRWGLPCLGVDYSSESVVRAKNQFPNLNHNIYKMDAFNLDFEDKTFDLTFHNGFWGCFPDEEINKLAFEQSRVSKYRMIATVHNAHNNSFKQYFDKLEETDPLYSVRFFTIEEITALMSKVSSKITVIPVGKGKKFHEDKLINKGLGNPILLNLYFNISKYRYLETSERLLCIGEL